MVLVKILKRKDASSVIIAIIAAMFLSQFIQAITNRWGIKLAHVNYGSQYFHWKEDYLLPVVWLLLELLVLEVLCWLWVWGAAAVKKK
jgi:hypothetical protein